MSSYIISGRLKPKLGSKPAFIYQVDWIDLSSSVTWLSILWNLLIDCRSIRIRLSNFMWIKFPFFHISAFEVLPSVIWYFSDCLLLTQSLALTHTCILSQYSHTPIAPICINTQQRLNEKEMIKWNKKVWTHAHAHACPHTLIHRHT